MYAEVASKSEWEHLFVLFVQHLTQQCQSHEKAPQQHQATIAVLVPGDIRLCL